MLKYVFNADLSYPNESVMFSAEDQTWDKETLKELKEKYNVIFMTSGDGVRPVMVLNNGKNPLLVVGSEDDGTISFEREYNQFTNAFHPYWVKSFISDLKEAVKLSGFKENEMKSEKFFDAADVVCLDCHYCQEDICCDCPVRKTADEIRDYYASNFCNGDKVIENKFSSGPSIQSNFEICEDCGWKVSEGSNKVTLSLKTLHDKDFSFSVDTKKDFVDTVKEYSEHFDPNEYVEMQIQKKSLVWEKSHLLKSC